MIQKNNNITLPSIVLEYLVNNDTKFELNDLTKFYKHFGEVDYLTIIEKKSIVLFRSFFSAYICMEFLSKDIYYKNNMKKYFKVSWFDFETDIKNQHPKVEKIYNDIINKKQ